MISRLRYGEGRVQGNVRILALAVPSATSDSWIRIVVPPITTRSIRLRMSVCEPARSGDSLPRAFTTRVSTSAAGKRRIHPAAVVALQNPRGDIVPPAVG